MSDFAEFLHDVFSAFGTVNCRKMFGGYGVYHNGVMFGLIADDILYLKADKSFAEEFLQRELPQFQYPKGDKMVKMSYFQAPEEIYDNTEDAERWARKAYRCAVKAKKEKRK